MKKVLGITVVFGLVEAVYAMTPCMNISKTDNGEMLNVDYQKIRKKIFQGECNLDAGVTVSWNGEVCRISYMKKAPTKLKIISQSIPVYLNFENDQMKVLCVNAPKTIIDGTLILKNNGALSMNNKLKIKGEILCTGDMEIRMGDDFISEVINKGKITCKSGILFGSGMISGYVSKFINRGEIRANKGNFQISESFINDGGMKFSELTISSLEIKEKKAPFLSGMLNFITDKIVPSKDDVTYFNDSLNFIQRGSCTVSENAFLNCDLESFGRTKIEHASFPVESRLIISGGQTGINKITGEISVLQTKNGAVAEIGKVEGNVRFVDSSDFESNLEIRKFQSNQKTTFSSVKGGKLKINGEECPKNFIYSKGGNIEFRGLKGPVAAIFDNAQVKIEDANMDLLVSLRDAHTDVRDSNLDKVYYLNHTNNEVKESDISSVHNRGFVNFRNTNIEYVNNEGVISFKGNSCAKYVNNSNMMEFTEGDHTIDYYNSRGKEARVTVKGKTNEEFPNPRERSQVNLISPGVQVSIKHISDPVYYIEADKIKFKNKLPRNAFLKGNVEVSLERMPKPYEIPNHQGIMNIVVNMLEDFVNKKDVLDYRDVIFSMDMNGFNWRNLDSSLKAGGLSVKNVSTFENKDGTIFLEKDLHTEANRFLNTATPIARDNGRWVKDASNWRALLVYFCPATYYESNPEKGIIVEGNVSLESNGDIKNEFSNIYIRGKFKAKAEVEFRNRVGNIVGFGPSVIEASDINNECLDAYERKGEAHAQGRCGWGPGRHTWYADSYTSEWITQSPGAKMIFEGDLTLLGNTKNVGSVISAGKRLQGNINQRSIITNTAKLESGGMSILGNHIEQIDAKVIVHLNLEENKND